VFEALACGTFVLTDSQRDVLALFKDGEHLAAFTDARDLRQKVTYFLARPEVRNRIATGGRREVLKKHTYTRRLETLLRVVDAQSQT
jgi:spore maturation protein CgeB